MEAGRRCSCGRCGGARTAWLERGRRLRRVAWTRTGSWLPVDALAWMRAEAHGAQGRADGGGVEARGGSSIVVTWRAWGSDVQAEVLAEEGGPAVRTTWWRSAAVLERRWADVCSRGVAGSSDVLAEEDSADDVLVLGGSRTGGIEEVEALACWCAPVERWAWEVVGDGRMVCSRWEARGRGRCIGEVRTGSSWQRLEARGGMWAGGGWSRTTCWHWEAHRRAALKRWTQAECSRLWRCSRLRRWWRA